MSYTQFHSEKNLYLDISFSFFYITKLKFIF